MMRAEKKVIRVLHVDDEPDFGETVAAFLRREDERFEIESATSAREGLDYLATSDFDCIVSDYDMPEKNGIEFLQDVREEHPDLPFILYTGKGSEDIASEAISAGVTDYIQKESGTSHYTVLANRVRTAVDRYSAQAKLADRERRLNLFFEQSPLGVIEWDESFEFVRQNGAAEEILGYPADELAGQSWEMIVPDSEGEAVGNVVSDLLDDTGGYHSINQNVRKDGERIVCEWHNRVVTDETGEVAAVFSQFQDITNREKRKRELEKYEAYLRGSTDIITVLDEDGTIQYQSPSVTRILGYESDELIGENGFELVHPEEREKAYETFQTILAGEKRHASVEVRLQTAGNEWHWLEIRGTNYLDNPDIEGIIVNSRDITARKEHEQALLETSGQLQALFEESPDMINVHDVDGNIIETNPRLCEETGYDETELVGMNVWDIDTTIEPDKVRTMWEEMEEGAQLRLEGEYQRKDDSTFPVEVHIRRHSIDDNIRFVVISRDISERKRREEQLEQFASVISHDLRNPLNVAQARLELAQEECNSEHLDTIEQSHTRIHALIEDLLTSAREGEQVGYTEEIRLATLVEDCWQTVETGDATLENGADLHLRADRSRLRQLLENLFRNGIKHAGREVTITVGEMPDGFYIEDDGPGIPESERGSVFDVGFSTAEKGTGFGLNIVEQIAEAHGWEISLTAAHSGGARFEITGVEIDHFGSVSDQ